jgi:hypothetical protein
MITMEFDEMKKIWDTQNNEPLYAINEKALHNRILSKKRKTNRITNITELLTIIVNLVSGISIIGLNFFNEKPSMSLYVLSVWMILTAVFFFLGRIRRTQRDLHFDRTVRGDLDYSISVATYQVRISQLMRWNILPTGIILLVSVWERGKSIWIAVGLFIFLVLTSYASGWEHRIYKGRKRELEILRNKLESDFN